MRQLRGGITGRGEVMECRDWNTRRGEVREVMGRECRVGEVWNGT